MIHAPNGASARSIWAHLVPGAGPQEGDYPHDSGDFGRCEALLQANPDLRANFSRMAEVNAYWAALVPEWLLICAQRDDAAKSAHIAAIVRPIQRMDPSHIQFGTNVSIRTGPNTFKGKPETPQEEPPRSGPGHNSGAADSYSVTADELRQFIERAEQLASEKKDIAEQEKELFAEAKGRGYDTKIMRKVIALRKRKPDEIAEEEAVLEMYKTALGMA